MRALGSAVLSTLALASCAGTPSIASAWPGSYLVVLEKGNGQALVIEPNGGAIDDHFATGFGPHEVAVSRNGQYAVVCNYGDGAQPGHTLTVYDLLEARRVRSIDLAPHTRPHGIVFLDRRSTVLITSETSAAVLEVDLRSGRVARTIPTGGKVSHMLALSPDKKRAYTTNIGSDSISVLDVEKGELSRTIATGRAPEALDVAPNGDIWVGHNVDGTIVVLDPTTFAVRATIADLAKPIRVKVTPDGAFAVVSCANADEVALIDARTLELVARIPLGEPDTVLSGTGATRALAPVGLEVEDRSKYAFVSLSGAARVVVVDLAERRVRGHYATGPGPDGLAWAFHRSIPTLDEGGLR